MNTRPKKNFITEYLQVEQKVIGGVYKHLFQIFSFVIYFRDQTGEFSPHESTTLFSFFVRLILAETLSHAL